MTNQLSYILDKEVTPSERELLRLCEYNHNFAIFKSNTFKSKNSFNYKELKLYKLDDVSKTIKLMKYFKKIFKFIPASANIVKFEKGVGCLSPLTNWEDKKSNTWLTIFNIGDEEGEFYIRSERTIIPVNKGVCFMLRDPHSYPRRPVDGKFLVLTFPSKPTVIGE